MITWLLFISFFLYYSEFAFRNEVIDHRVYIYVLGP